MQYINSGFNVTTIKYPYLWIIRALWDYERDLILFTAINLIILEA